MKLTKLGLLLICSLALFSSSCIRENLEECYSRNYLEFSYLGDGTDEIFNEKINRVELFIFDSQDRFVASKVCSDNEVAARTAKLPNLHEGKYRIICVANTHHTQVDGLKSLDYERMIFASDDYFAGVTMHGDDSLYYASDYYEVEPYETQLEDKYQVIRFASSHYDLLVEVVGVPAQEEAALRGGSTSARLVMEAVTPVTDFENRVTGGPGNYHLYTDYDADGMLLTALTNIMRHKNHEDVNLHFYASEGATEPMVTVNLADFLAAHPYIDCDKHEVLIPIRIEFNSVDVTVTVPEWFIIHVRPDFDIKPLRIPLNLQ